MCFLFGGGACGDVFNVFFFDCNAPGFTPGYIFLNPYLNETIGEYEAKEGIFECNGTASECVQYVTCDQAAGYSGTVSLWFDWKLTLVIWRWLCPFYIV